MTRLLAKDYIATKSLKQRWRCLHLKLSNLQLAHSFKS